VLDVCILRHALLMTHFYPSIATPAALNKALAFVVIAHTRLRGTAVR
jgi:hypothetical protein